MEHCEACNICSENRNDVVDSLCTDCEPMWLDSITILSNRLVPDTPIGELFKQAEAMTKERFNASKNNAD